VSVFDVGTGIRYFCTSVRYSVSVFLKYRDIGIGIRYFAIVYNFWSNKATAGLLGIPVLKTQNSPAKEKVPENFRSVK